MAVERNGSARSCRSQGESGKPGLCWAGIELRQLQGGQAATRAGAGAGSGSGTSVEPVAW